MLSFMAHRLGVVASSFVVLALVACGGSAGPDAGEAQNGGDSESIAAAPDDGQTGSGNGDIDLCAVLTLEEVSAAAGVEVTDATGANAEDVSSCNYSTADGTPVAGNTYTTGGEAIDPSAMIDANLGDGAEEISGLGDRAVLTGDENFPILMVLKGEGLYSISVLADNLDGEGKRQATIDLARLSLDRLP